ncbi:MAG TPA: hypothetical protein VFX63_01835, partial [Pyrinomonadaceae bacterium]|nr:hypothetical protein [Pyrinomonadaceae bacterium]
DDNEVVTATILDANLNPLSIGDGVLAPRRFVNFSPRVDYALNANNTLVARYSYNRSKLQNNGVGNFSLPERAYDSLLTSSNIQLTETAVINPTTINETRFQFTRSQNELLGDSSKPTVVVSGSFIGGSSQVGHSVNTDQRWELSNFTAIQQGQHTYKIGARLRHAHIVSINKSNFGGQYVFTGALVPQLDANGEIIQNSPPIPVDSLERYRRNLILNPRTLLPVDDLRHLTALDVRSRGGGAAQFSINTGNPEASVSQFDLAFYGQDDWRVRPNLTLSYGLRYEYQSNIHSPFNFAPRMAMAWSPGTPSRGRPPKMVIRAGFGVFYLRFNESSTLQANRFSGDRNSAQQFIVKENLLFDSNGQPVPPVATPLDAFPNLPPLADVSDPTQQITWHVAEDLRSSVAYGFGAQVERQLPHKFTMFAGVFIFQIQHLFRARDINAPLPGTITSTDLNGIRPFGDVGEINVYESSGRLNQNQIFVGFNSRFNQSISFFSNYSLAHASSDAEGQGARTFPVNSYDLHGEYGRASTDIRHRFAFGGTWTLPWWGLTLNPFILASTGAPFNIITGADPNGDGQFMERPSFAPAGTVCGGPSQPINVVCTQFGNFNLKPAPGEELIPRNYGHSPGYFIVNLSASKTLFFGTIHSGNSAATASRKTSGPGASATGSGKAAAAGASTVGGTPAKAVTGIPGLGPAGLGSGEAKRYSLQISINVQNLFNRVNFQPPEGNLSSPSFGQSLGLNGFGGVSAPGSVGAGNRRIIARVRFTF